MISRKLTEVLTSLSEQELERLTLFVLSPYFNNGNDAEQLADLLEYILQAIAADRWEALEKEALQARYFPDHPFVPKKKNAIDALSSNLFQLIKAFIYQEADMASTSKTRRLLALAKFYRTHSFEERFWQTVNQMRRTQEREQVKGPDYYLDGVYLEEEVSRFESIFNTYSGDANLVALHQNLDRFYSIVKLDYSTALQFQENLGQLSSGQAFRLSEAILEAYPDYEGLHTPLASLYYRLIKMLRHPPAEEELNTFLEVAYQYEQEIPKVAFRNLMAIHRFFVVQQFRHQANGLELVDRLFELYQDHLEKGYFNVDDRLLPASLKTMVNIAIKKGELAWAKDLLERYGPDQLTGTRYPVEAHSLCLAEVHFAEMDYQAAEEHLEYRKFENVNYSILADILLVKIYFVTGNELLESRVHALEQKIRRSRLNEDNQRPYLNFINLIKRIIRYQWDRTSSTWSKIREDVTTLTPLLERDWLLDITKD